MSWILNARFYICLSIEYSVANEWYSDLFPGVTRMTSATGCNIFAVSFLSIQNFDQKNLTDKNMFYL